ncbi:MAG: acyltransferase [Bacteroides sp.]|nr:acyltransferase [Bacteroides sp.]MCM1085129.1 acyltransferase [Bacteroides sp.]
MTGHEQDSHLPTAGETQSDTIYFLRFLLIAAVAFTHSAVSKPQSFENAYSLFVFIFTSVFERLPALVLFSGFLFFKSGFSARIYGKKLKNRIKSLLIPYLFWNAAVVIYYLLLQFYLLKNGQQPDSKLISDYTWHDWQMAFWNGPIAKQFWFIRNLMILMLASPFFYLLIRYLRWFGVLLSAVPWIMGVEVLWGMHTYTFFFFAVGACMALKNENFVLRMGPYWGWAGILFLLTACFRIYRFIRGLPDIPIIDKIGLCASVVFIIALTGKLISSGTLKVNVALCKSSFFIFAAHLIPVVLVKMLLESLLPATIWSCFVIHFATFTLVLFLCLGVYRLLHRFTPRFLSFISGGR